ncbi:MAG: phage holin family protein [Bacteroidales bacterium]|nr:phage holin family protein [Bacteroidales bacterium]
MKERSFQDYFKIFKRDITKYVELKLDYYKLEFVEVFSEIFSKLISIGVILLLGIILTTFLLFALAFFLGEILGAYYWGFLIVSGIFMLMAIFFILMRNKILTNPLINALVAVLFGREIGKHKRTKIDNDGENK